MTNSFMSATPGFQGICWLDVETTGLSPFLTGEKLLQVACYVTDTDLNFKDEEGYESVVNYPEKVVRKMFESTSPFVQNMHEATGLWGRLSNEGLALEELDTEVTEYVKQFYPEKNTVWLAGNSIFLDRSFISAYLPKLDEHLHYRSVDVTSIAGLAQNWYGVAFEKKKTHDARDDIMESINELKFLREKVFK